MARGSGSGSGSGSPAIRNPPIHKPQFAMHPVASTRRPRPCPRPWLTTPHPKPPATPPQLLEVFFVFALGLLNPGSNDSIQKRARCLAVLTIHIHGHHQVAKRGAPLALDLKDTEAV